MVLMKSELLNYTDVDIRNEFYEICNEIYEKKKRLHKCKEYRTLNLTTLPLKSSLK